MATIGLWLLCEKDAGLFRRQQETSELDLQASHEAVDWAQSSEMACFVDRK